VARHFAGPLSRQDAELGGASLVEQTLLAPGSVHLPRLLHFRDAYYARSLLLDHINNDGFNYWSNRLFALARGLLHWRAFRLSFGNHSLRNLGYLTRFTAFS
jgi:hypothetical protein